VPYNNLDALGKAINENTAAVLLEVVQGEGGVYPGTPEYLRGAEQLCHEHSALLILDEVQTGFGRTGKMFAFQHYDLHPDLVCLAKSIAGGVPMGATMIGERLGVMPGHIHGSTFGGNPLACAASLAALSEMERLDLPKRAAENGAYFLERLQEINSPILREARGLGLLVGVELKKKSAPFLQALMEHGVMALSAGMNVIRFLPPLVITREQLDRVADTLTQVLVQPASEEEAKSA
jgi:acetylornithine/LysW-gamma-L-lysine aminotransferase